MKIEDVIKNSPPHGNAGLRRFWRNGDYYAVNGKGGVLQWNGRNWHVVGNGMFVVLVHGGIEYA